MYIQYGYYCSYKRDTDTHTQCVKMEAEIEVMYLQAKEYQELVAPPKARNDVKNRSLSHSLQKERTKQIP